MSNKETYILRVKGVIKAVYSDDSSIDPNAKENGDIEITGVGDFTPSGIKEDDVKNIREVLKDHPHHLPTAVVSIVNKEDSFIVETTELGIPGDEETALRILAKVPTKVPTKVPNIKEK